MTDAELLDELVARLHARGVPGGCCRIIIDLGQTSRPRRVIGEHWSWPRRYVFGLNELRGRLERQERAA